MNLTLTPTNPVLRISVPALVWCALVVCQTVAQDSADDLESRLKWMDVAVLAERVLEQGSPQHGALVFYTSAAACHKCHAEGEEASPLGPDLATIGREVTSEQVIDSILRPSRTIRKGYETVTLLTSDGKIFAGLVASDDEDQIVLRDAANLEEEINIKQSDIEERVIAKKSMMPLGLVSSLRSEQQFYDLARYVIEVAHGGPVRAAQLKPRPEDLAVHDDWANLDHAGILRSLGPEDFEAGNRIYLSHCKNCHGVDGNQPNLPTARAFGTEKLKFGADPYNMFLTLTRGNGLMAPMSHLSPKERYQVVHFIRQQLIRPAGINYQSIDDGYLESLPKGSSTGEFTVGSERDFGPVLASQLESEVNNALNFRLPDEVTVNYDLHRMRLGGVWRGGFLDLSQTHHYRQRGEQMPQIDGTLVPGLTGWQWAFAGSFEISADAKPARAPVRSDWLQYFGHYLYADRAILSYEIHGRRILETIDSSTSADLLVIRHALRIGAGEQLMLSVGQFDRPANLIPIGQFQSGKRTGNTLCLSAMMDDGVSHFIATAVGDVAGLTWSTDNAGRMVLTIPRSSGPRVLRIARSHGVGEEHVQHFSRTVALAEANSDITDPLNMTHGGPLRWPQKLTVQGNLGQPINGYALDTIPVPFDNPWNAWLRTSALDFFEDGRAVVTTYGGDVYIVSGIDEKLKEVTWSRFAAGLFEPFGVRVVDGTIYVTCRDGIKRLHDYDNNGEADFIAAFWTDDDVSSVFHAFNFDLQTDSQGNFYLAKTGQHTDYHRPGTIMRIPSEGGRADIVAWGIRTPNGMGMLDDDRMTVSDNQGPWMPAGKVSLIQQGGFHGSMPNNKDQDTWLRAQHGGKLPDTFVEPVIWTPQELDNSGGGQVWCSDKRWGPLAGRLIHSSYGKGRLYYLSLQQVDHHTQASIVKLPHQWDAGVMRLRVNPRDGQVYGTGLSGWQGPPGGKDGCLQRLRYTGDSVRIIESVCVTATGLALTFNFSIDPASAGKLEAWNGEMWDYLWSSRYGSDQFSVRNQGELGRDKLTVTDVVVENGNKSVLLDMPDLAVCDQVSLKMQFSDAAGKDYAEHVYLTVHAIPD